jgi:hypothetical protein
MPRQQIVSKPENNGLTEQIILGFWVKRERERERERGRRGELEWSSLNEKGEEGLGLNSLLLYNNSSLMRCVKKRDDKS